MKKVKFTNKYFYYFLIIFFLFLLGFNLYYLYCDYDLFILFPITIQLVILSLLIYKDYRFKLVLKFWSGIFLILANGLIFFGKLLKDFSNNFQSFDYKSYLWCIFMLIIGLGIFIFNERMVCIVENSPDNGKSDVADF